MIKRPSTVPPGSDRLVLRLVRAAAYATDPAVEGFASDQDHETIRFMPLAASAGRAALPSRLVASDGGLVEALIVAEGQTITLRIRALGHAAVKRMRRRRGRFVTSDGAVDHLAEFDRTGECTLSLASSDAVVTGLLGGFDIVMDG